jgi:acetone carboxylase gamma subunit
MKANAYVHVTEHDGELVLRCRCGHVLGPASESYKRLSHETRRPIQAAGSCADPYRIGEGRFELREYSCPSCLVLYEIEVALTGDPILDDVLLDLEGEAVDRAQA